METPEPTVTPAPDKPSPPDGKSSDKPTPDLPPGVRSENFVGALQAGGSVNMAAVQYLLSLSWQEKPKLSMDAFLDLSMEKVKVAAKRVICEEAALVTMVAKLKQRRLIVLAGEAKAGKRSLANAVAYRLWMQENLTLMHVLRMPPDRGTRVDLPAFLDEIKESGRFLVLPDALSKENPDLKGLLTELNQEQVDELVSKLQKRNSFLVLTSDSKQLGPEATQQLKRLDFLHEMRPLPAELLEEGLRQRSQEVAEKQRLPQLTEAIERILNASSGTIVRKLATMYRIEEFVNDWLTQVADGKNIALDLALDRVGKREAWLLIDLPRNFEAWAAVLALTLCQAPGPSVSCTWLQFDLVRRDLSRFLRQELRLSNKPLDRGSFAEDIFDEALWQAARIEIEPLNSSGPSFVRFRDEQDSEQIWQVLFGPGRRLFGLLFAFCERRALSSQQQVAEVAAQALGRMGETDLRTVILRWMRNFSTLDPDRHTARLGNLFQGVLGSHNSAYQDLCLWYLRSQMASGVTDDALAAIKSQAWIGAIAPDIALESLRGLAAEKLAPNLENRSLNGLGAEMGDIERRALAAGSLAVDPHRTIGERSLITAINLIFPQERPKEELQRLLAVAQALVWLARFYGALWLFSALHGWKSKSPSKQSSYKRLTALLFLDPWGIAASLESIRVPYSEASTAQPAESLEFTWLCAGILTLRDRKDLDILVGFLEEVREAIDSFPPLLKRELRNRFRDLLLDWARQGFSQTASQNAARRVFGRILNSGLGETLAGWAAGDHDSELKAFREFVALTRG